MLQLRPLDSACPIEHQLAIDAEPVVLVNVFTLDPADEAKFLEAWQEDAAFMKQQSGFISTQLHRGLGERASYMNYAIWESTAHFRAAFSHPAFRASLAAYPSSVIASPHIFQKVAVQGICGS
ncbi:antibiotic biosynthesis monooxygenase family protein [Paraburkholderia sp. JHI869]|uniref:antibiotic biosynthesis monooxygenase family protein n=1 Tax=Paraburkholderia sp. JHI869 TaxID=3112959 RepID=UPI003173C89E